MFVLFKQKTAYEMLISDWMSDVCSSDLTQLTFLPVAGGGSLQTGLTDAHTTFKKLTWRIALDQQLAPGILAYASYNRGFKSGLYNSIPPSADVIQPEVLDASGWSTVEVRSTNYRTMQAESAIAKSYHRQPYGTEAPITPWAARAEAAGETGLVPLSADALAAFGNHKMVAIKTADAMPHVSSLQFTKPA